MDFNATLRFLCEFTDIPLRHGAFIFCDHCVCVWGGGWLQVLVGIMYPLVSMGGGKFRMNVPVQEAP